jgi:hypothetical protein
MYHRPAGRLSINRMNSSFQYMCAFITACINEAPQNKANQANKWNIITDSPQKQFSSTWWAVKEVLSPLGQPRRRYFKMQSTCMRVSKQARTLNVPSVFKLSKSRCLDTCTPWGHNINPHTLNSKAAAKKITILSIAIKLYTTSQWGYTTDCMLLVNINPKNCNCLTAALGLLASCDT